MYIHIIDIKIVNINLIKEFGDRFRAEEIMENEIQ